MGTYDEIQRAYGEDLDAVEKRHLMLRVLVQLRNAITKQEDSVSERVQDEIAHKYALAMKHNANQEALITLMFEADSRERMNNLDNYIRGTSSLISDHNGMLEELSSSAISEITDALQVYKRDFPATVADDVQRAGWESILGTTLTPSPMAHRSPSAAQILATATQEYGAFDASGVRNEVAVRNFERLAKAAARSEDRHAKHRASLSAQLDALREITNVDDKTEISARFDEIIETAERRKDKSMGLAMEDVSTTRMVKEELAADKEYQKMVERSDRLWKSVLGKDTDAQNMRTALGTLLSKPWFQEWADDNGFVVGTSQVVDGNITEFNPGKDLMVAVKIAMKQRSARPRPGDKGPLIARKGARELVRVTTKDGEIVLGKRLPMQAADEKGSMRISTTGGERYIAPDDLKRSEVLKTKTRFNLADQMRKTRGDLDRMRAESAMRAIVGTPETPEIASTELEDPPGSDDETLDARDRLAVQARLAAMNAPATGTEAQAMDALVASATKPGSQAPPPPPPRPRAGGARVPVQREKDRKEGNFSTILEGSPDVSGSDYDAVLEAERRNKRTNSLKGPPNVQGSDVPTAGTIVENASRRRNDKNKKRNRR